MTNDDFAYHFTSKLDSFPLSVFLPVIDCDVCGKERKSELFFQADTNIDFHLLVQSALPNNKSGFRSIPAEQFVENNLKFVGHSSCIKPLIPNFYLENNEWIFLYDAPLAIWSISENTVEFSGGKGLDVEQNHDMDMRSIWSTGEAEHLFPQFFKLGYINHEYLEGLYKKTEILPTLKMLYLISLVCWLI